MLTAVPQAAEDASPYAFAAVVLVAGIAWLGTLRGRAPRVLLWVALVACVAIIGWLTLPHTVVGMDVGRSVNLTLFQEIERALRSDSRIAWLNLIGNLAMFAPLGAVLVALLRGNVILRALAATALAGLLSVGIELTQLALGRVADVDDVLLNSAGALAGAVTAAVVIGIVRAVRGDRYDGGRASSSVGRAADF